MTRSRWLVLLGSSVVQTLLWALVLAADPFGMSSAADNASQSIFLKLYAAGYPSDAQDAIRVVVIDEDDLPLFDNGTTQWPLQFSDHVALIEKILTFKPKGVFVDFLFDTDQYRDPNQIAAFVQKQVAAKSPPVVFASYRDPKTLIEPLRELSFTGYPVSLGLVETTSSPYRYVLRDETGTRSAALALYEATDGRVAEDLDEMVLAWGFTFSDKYRKGVEEAGCTALFDDDDGRMSALWRTAVAGALVNIGWSSAGTSPSWDRLQPCPFHREIRARDLFQGDQRELRRALRDSYVLIGASIDGSNDTVVSPVHGQLPGVYLHAMALDNLIAFDGKPLVTAGYSRFFQGGLIFCCVLFGGVAFGRHALPSSRAAALGALLLRAVAWAVFALASVAILFALLDAGQWAPDNWGGVFAIAGVVFFSGAGGILSALIWGAPAASES